ncbi:hypothetical protein BG015_011292 [Linnemannia schmuckeri]|uniref:Uncharacterized protein n=1 Tax=Linnemannia schmuckeri TaxID=64567 RepID=A0A9P5V7Z9_9FUNG|nr:hypothetical protein BG015_011292 [Linnemannia schmuckeri]
MVLVHPSPLPWTTSLHALSAQRRSTAPPLACKTPSATLPVVRPQSVRSTSYSSVPRLKDIDVSLSARPSSSTAINIPSPPLTPHLNFDDDHTFQQEPSSTVVDPEDDSDSGIFSSRFQRQHRLQRDEQELKLRPSSSSAPSAMSPLEMRASSNVPMTTTGFTFTSNTHAKEARESYEYFLSTMEDDYWKSVSTIRTTYFFDGIGRGGGFLAIPHLASHGNAKTNVICRLLEAWLTKKLVEPTISDSIPVLEDNIQSSVESIEQHLRQDPKVWSGISKSYIHIRCGHVFMLNTCCDDETIVHLGADEFYQDYPLFVDVEIKMNCESNYQPKESHLTEVLIAFQNVVNRGNNVLKGTDSEKDQAPYVHRALIGETIKRRSSQANCLA